jgi:hypothetical protein
VGPQPSQGPPVVPAPNHKFETDSEAER